MAYPLPVLLVWLALVTLTLGAHLIMYTDRSTFQVDAEYLSVTLDFQLVAVPPGIPRWYTLNAKNPRVVSLLRGLSPCYLRFGGSQADMTVLSNPPAATLYSLPTALRLSTIYASDIDLLVELTRASGCRLMYDLNLNLRYATGWDPTNALRTLTYMVNKDYGDNIDFELGNEPDLPKTRIAPPWPYPPVTYARKEDVPSVDGTSPSGLLGKRSSELPGGFYGVPTEGMSGTPPSGLPGTQIGADFMVLKQLLAGAANFRSSRLVGADIATLQGLKRLMPGFLKTAGANISATTFHQYYFNGHGAHPAEYINPKHFDWLRSNIRAVKKLVKDHSPKEDLPVWIGETADAWNSGTQNVSDRYISGFLWLDKLGLAAQAGVSVVIRQTFYGGFYGLIDGDLYPNPDYWVSYIHKRLVGRTVFKTSLLKNGKDQNRRRQWRLVNKTNKRSAIARVRLYAHCTKPSLKLICRLPCVEAIRVVYIKFTQFGSFGSEGGGIGPMYVIPNSCTQYQRGALTVLGINLLNHTEAVTFNPALVGQRLDQYLLTPAEPDNLLSGMIALNGKPMRLVDDLAFPVLTPVTLLLGASGVHLPGLTMVFWVFPDAGLSVCVRRE